MKPSKIKNSLSKGRLFVYYYGKEYEVLELFTKRVSLRSNEDGQMFNASVYDIEFKEFIKHKQ